MSDGLVGSLVARSFWPSCANCYHLLGCMVWPKHPSFPDTWPWARCHIPFREGDLIVKSWVGNSALYVPHDSCAYYMVGLRFVRMLKLDHERYLSLEWQSQRVHAELNVLEDDGIETEETQRLNEELRRLLDMQHRISHTFAPIGSEEEPCGPGTTT